MTSLPHMSVSIFCAWGSQPYSPSLASDCLIVHCSFGPVELCWVWFTQADVLVTHSVPCTCLPAAFSFYSSSCQENPLISNRVCPFYVVPLQSSLPIPALNVLYLTLWYCRLQGYEWAVCTHILFGWPVFRKGKKESECLWWSKCSPICQNPPSWYSYVQLFLQFTLGLWGLQTLFQSGQSHRALYHLFFVLPCPSAVITSKPLVFREFPDTLDLSLSLSFFVRC